MKKRTKSRKSKKDGFGNWIDESLRYIKESQMYIYIVVGAFVLSMLLGFFIVPLSPDLSGIINKSISGIVEKTINLSGIELILFIFKNNLWVSLEGVFTPLLILDTLFKGDIMNFLQMLILVPIAYFLGVMQVLLSAINGIVLGYVLSKVYAVSGINDFWRLFPHGIFELPAVFISLGLGMKMGTFWMSRKPGEEFKRRFTFSVKTFITIVIPLLLIAAVIEGLLITLTG